MFLAAFTSAWQAKPQAVHSEARLTLTRLRVHLPARRAPLARVMRLDLLHPAGRLVRQPTHQQAPPRTQDPPVQPGLRPDVRPGFSRVPLADRSCCRSSGPRPGSRRTAARCRSWSSRPSPCAGPSPGPAAGRSRASPARGGSSPAWRGPASAACAAAWSAPARSGRGRAASRRSTGRGDRHAPVDAHHLAVAGCGNRRGDHGEGDMPAARAVHGHPVGLHALRYRAGPAEPDPPGLRHPDPAGFPADPAHVPLPATPHDPESLIPPGLAPVGRPAGCPGRRTPSSPGRSRAAPAAGPSGAGGQPRVFPRARVSSGSAPVARRAAAAGASGCCSTARFHTYRRAAVVPQHRLLGGWESRTGTSNTISDSTDISGEVRAFPPRPEGRVSTPRS